MPIRQDSPAACMRGLHLSPLSLMWEWTQFVCGMYSWSYTSLLASENHILLYLMVQCVPCMNTCKMLLYEVKRFGSAVIRFSECSQHARGKKIIEKPDGDDDPLLLDSFKTLELMKLSPILIPKKLSLLKWQGLCPENVQWFEFLALHYNIDHNITVFITFYIARN